MKKYLLFVGLAIVALCLLGTPARATYYDAININLSDAIGGTGDVTGPLAPPQGFGNIWNNLKPRPEDNNPVNSCKYYSTKAPGNNPPSNWSIGGVEQTLTIQTANGITVPISGGSPFSLSWYAEGCGMNANGSLLVNQGTANTLPNDYLRMQAGWGWSPPLYQRTPPYYLTNNVYGNNVPFTTYDVYVLTGGGGGAWSLLGSCTGASFSLSEPGARQDAGIATYAAIQILSKDAPPTGSLRINKWNDLDGDGEWLPDGDQLLGGWTFNVSDVSPTLTDNGPLDEDPLDGTILVTGLTPGQYTIMESLVGHDGWNWTHGLLVATVNPGEEAVADWANHYTPPVVAEPAGLGLVGIALLALRKRRS